jgi:DNA polymerase phi
MSTLPLYWKLSSTHTEDRLSASVTLISALEGFQAQYAPPLPVSDSDEESEEKQPEEALSVDSMNAEDVRYAIRRLVRGLASPREMSRLGFAVALTEVPLAQYFPSSYGSDTLPVAEATAED